MSRKSNKSSLTIEPRRSDPVRRPDAVRPSDRSTFRVAQANRILSATLDKVAYLERPNEITPPRRQVLLDPVRRDTPVRDDKRLSERLDTPLPDRPSLRDDAKVCKERPKDSRRSGSGASRPFVPWCSRRS